MKPICKPDFGESIRFLKCYIIHRTKLLWYRIRTGKPWPLYDCYFDKMGEDLDNVPELDPFFVSPIYKVHYKIPVDLAIRDSWMPYLYSNAPFFILFRNNYREPGYYEDFLPLSICRHPKVLVSDYKPGITKEDFDWTVRFVKDNRKDLWIYGHFHDEQAYDRILDYIEKHPASDENVAAAHFGIFRSCREDFADRLNEAMKKLNLFDSLYYCYLYVISGYAADERYPYLKYKDDFDSAVQYYEKSDISIAGLKTLRDITLKFAESDNLHTARLPVNWSMEKVTRDYFKIAAETEATIGLIPVDDSMSENSGLSSLAQRKKYEKDYAGFAYLWAVSIFSANISEFLYDQYEMFWEKYEKTPKDTIVTCIRNFLGLFGTRLKDGGCIYHRLSATDFHSAYPFPDSEAGIGWKDGYSLLKQALIYVSPFADMK